LVGDEKGLFFECDDQPKNSTTSAPLTDVDPTDTLQTLLSTVGKECPKTFAKQTTLSKLRDWVDLQATVYQCAMSGALPRNTSKDRQHIWSKPISSSNETEHDGSHGSLYEHDTENNEQTSLMASLSFVCSSEHRLDYLNAMVPGTKKMLQQNQCKAIAGRKPFSMASSTLELTIKRYRQSYSKSGKLVIGGQDPGNHADHPLRTSVSSTYTRSPRRRRFGTRLKDAFGWRRRRRRRRRAPVTRHDARKEWKQLKCPTEQNPDFDSMFANKVHDGCSSPIKLAWKNAVTPPCFVHDMCYSCSTSQSKCDDDFKKNLKAECSRKVNWFLRWTCTGQAIIMHLAVKFAGKVDGNGPDWCKSSCAVAYWKNPTQATFKLTDPWF